MSRCVEVHYARFVVVTPDRSEASECWYDAVQNRIRRQALDAVGSRSHLQFISILLGS
jgi:hypothetical protein